MLAATQSRPFPLNALKDFVDLNSAANFWTTTDSPTDSFPKFANFYTS